MKLCKSKKKNRFLKSEVKYWVGVWVFSIQNLKLNDTFSNCIICHMLMWNSSFFWVDTDCELILVQLVLVKLLLICVCVCALCMSWHSFFSSLLENDCWHTINVISIFLQQNHQLKRKMLADASMLLQFSTELNRRPLNAYSWREMKCKYMYEMLKKTSIIIIMHQLIFGIWDVIHYVVWFNVTHFEFRFSHSCSNNIHWISFGRRICRQLNIKSNSQFGYEESTPNVERRWIFNIHSLSWFWYFRWTEEFVLMFSRANCIKYVKYLFSD